MRGRRAALWREVVARAASAVTEPDIIGEWGFGKFGRGYRRIVSGRAAPTVPPARNICPALDYARDPAGARMPMAWVLARMM